MDAREALEWLNMKLGVRKVAEARRKAEGQSERAPISELEWRRLKALRSCSFGTNYGAKRFVYDMIAKGYNASITRNQSEYIQMLWHRYRRQHQYKLAQPDSEIMRFIDELPIAPYECNPENDPFTIQFSDAEDRFF